MGDTSLTQPEVAYWPYLGHKACCPWRHDSFSLEEVCHKVGCLVAHASDLQHPWGSCFQPCLHWDSWHWARHCSLAAWGSLLVGHTDPLGDHSSPWNFAGRNPCLCASVLQKADAEIRPSRAAGNCTGASGGSSAYNLDLGQCLIGSWKDV